MEYLQGILAIFFVNLLLSGDNALVIALASRNLAERQRKAALFWGSAGAIVLRIALAMAAVPLLNIDYLKIIGGLLLLWIAIKLLQGNHDEQPDNIGEADDIWGAVKTILIADLVMSLDNALAIAAISKGSISLLVIGLAISIPIIVWGSKAINLAINRWPVIIVVGAAFLGWTAGEMIIGDNAIQPYLGTVAYLHWVVPGACAGLVLLSDYFIKDRLRDNGF